MRRSKARQAWVLLGRAAGATLAAAFALMLLLGMFHSWDRAVPAPGWWPCVVVQLLVDVVLASSVSGIATRVEWLWEEVDG